MDFKASPTIKKGLGETNRVRLDCIRSTLTGFVNGQQVAQIDDTDRLWGGNQPVGASVPRDAKFLFDNLTLSVPKPSPDAVLDAKAENAAALPTPTLHK